MTAFSAIVGVGAAEVGRLHPDKISAIASEPGALELLLERLLIITLDVLGSPAGAIHLLNDPPKQLNLIAQVAIPECIAAEFAGLPLTEPFWRNLLRTSEPVIVPDLKIDPRVPDQLRASSYRAFIAAPIRAKGQSLGLLSVMSESIMDYTIEDITLLTTIAENIGSAVERARWQQQAERAAVVVDNGVVVGMITRADIARLAEALEMLPNRA